MGGEIVTERREDAETEEIAEQEDTAMFKHCDKLSVFSLSV